MPSRPPSLKPPKARAARTVSNWSRRESRHVRGYGRAHDLMRAMVLLEEPLCRICLAHDRCSATVIADHIIPKAEQGTDERSNYQGLCKPCHRVKTAAEAARGVRRSPRPGGGRNET